MDLKQQKNIGRDISKKKVKYQKILPYFPKKYSIAFVM